MSNNDDDSNATLGEISRHHGKSIIELLLDIQESQFPQKKVLAFVENMECLALHHYNDTHFSRRSINAFRKADYVALSYTWDASESEETACGRYKVQTRDKNRRIFSPSEVRNCVFDRIIKYMRKYKTKLLWIDQHSLQQAICERADCEDIECEENREGIETMDLVYKLSSHPVALLTTRMESVSDLKLLRRILSGDLVDYNRSKSAFQLSTKTTTLREAVRAMEILRRLTEDNWWKRGWIFQEGYRSGTALRLLIPHSPSMEFEKLSNGGAEIFSGIPGELRINATVFSYQATQLCLAFDAMDSPPHQVRQSIGQILETAGRYTLILGKHESMSPTIFSDLSKRNLKRHWDQLAIAANCCQYSTRLDIKALSENRSSFSLSKLALFLLNGELLFNDSLVHPAEKMTVLEFMASQSFEGFYAPLDLPSLSFNKGCRLLDVELTSDGILTKGHLWRLGRTIDGSYIQRRPSGVVNWTGMLGRQSRKRLTQLANVLEDLRHEELEVKVRKHLNRDTASVDKDHCDTFSSCYMRDMASELADAIERGMSLRLACIWDPSGEYSPYQAIFICKEDQERQEWNIDRSSGRSKIPLVFTAFSARRENTTEYGANDLDRHVSLEVDLVDSAFDPEPSIPFLEIKSWILGLCFFEGVPRTDVLFPWPPGFEEISA